MPPNAALIKDGQIGVRKAQQRYKTTNGSAAVINNFYLCTLLFYWHIYVLNHKSRLFKNTNLKDLSDRKATVKVNMRQ